MSSENAKSLLNDPRYPAFAERYAFDLVRFAVEVCMQVPTWQQVEMYESVQAPGSRTSVSSGHGCFARGTEIMRADGSIVSVEDVLLGDRIMGPDGDSVRTVLDLKRGREAMYRFTYADGTSHVFNESHILCLVATNSKGRRVAGQRVTTTVRDWLTWGEDRKRCHAIYRSGVETFDGRAASLPVPPYILGAWLGDGDCAAVVFTTEDPEIVEAVLKWAGSMGCHLKVYDGNSGNAKRYHVTNGRMGPNQAPAMTALRGLGVLGNKHIPDSYLYASKADRLELLAGLIDTDGSLGKASFDFIQKNERLARQVAWLARSVGCHATIRSTVKTCGNNGVSGTYWRVTIGRNIDQVPVRLARKRPAECNRQRGNLHFSIKSCEPMGEGDYYGFVLDGDSRFLGGDFTVLHNTGKTRSFGVTCFWHVLCYRFSNTYLTGPKLKTVQEGVWKEFAGLKDSIDRGPHAWINEYLILERSTVYIRGHKLNWFCTARTAPRGAPEGLAGTHADWLLWVADEASGIDDGSFGVIGGALTDSRNRLALASQPTRASGFFYDTHHKLSIHGDGDFVPLVFNSEESPLVSDEFIQEKLIQYGGRQSPEYQIKVLGRFPENSDKYLIGRGAIQKRIDGPPVISESDAYGHVLIIDVAAGVHRDRTVATHLLVYGDGDRVEYAIAPRRVQVVKVPIYTNALDWTPVARMATDYAATLSNCTVVVDCGGQGVQFAKRMEEFGCPNVIKVNWGKKPFKKRNSERFFNLRAQACVHAAEAVKDGRAKFTRDHEADLLDQGSRIPFYIDERGLWHIMRKEDMAKEGIPSPDFWDTICMAFLEGVHYIQAETSSEAVMSARLDSARDEALKALEGIA